MAAVGNATIEVTVELKPPLSQGFFIFLPVSDALIAGAERGAVVEELAEKYAGDAAKAAVKQRRWDLLDKGDRG